jgi:NAD-dependent dihydropyrimidine dehydrogenase PreA subunit
LPPNIRGLCIAWLLVTEVSDYRGGSPQNRLRIERAIPARPDRWGTKKWLPVVDWDRCSGCASCVHVCRRGCPADSPIPRWAMFKRSLRARGIGPPLLPYRAFLETRGDRFRQQLAVLKRKRPRRHLDRLDRFFWIALRRCWSRWIEALVIVKPETVVSCSEAFSSSFEAVRIASKRPTQLPTHERTFGT